MPEITLDVCEQIEVVDGWMVRCGSPTHRHQTIAHNFVSSLRAAVKSADRKEGSCHKVAGDYDVLISECLNVRRRDFHAVDVFDPFGLRMTWEQLDDGL